MGEFSPPPPFSEPPSFFLSFFLFLSIEIIFDFSYIFTKIHPPFQTPGSALEVRNLSYENEFCMRFHFHANQSHFHKNGFALRLALK